MMTTGQPLHYPDTAQEPEWLPIPGTRWIRSYLAVPLAVGNQVLGFLNLNSDQPNFFASSMIPALQSFAAHASIAIQNARQYQALQKALEHEQAMRDQLIHADRLASMGRMAGSIAHEINNPLQAIQGCIERSLVFPGDVARQQRYLGMAQQEITRLAEIVQRVMNYQRPVVGMMQTEDPRSILEDVLALSGKRLQHAKVDVSISWEDNLPKVHVITNQIKQVFLNLLLNAVDAMPKGGSLTISARRVEQDGDWLAIAFKDTGQGMSKESREHIFEPFFSTKASGTGLGLWVSKNILDSHDGRITAESASGEGTTMTVWLPLKK
jgi:two-component system NtrC family sensor kinase